MDAIAHLSGCNGRHTARQRCNGQPLLAPISVPVEWEITQEPSSTEDASRLSRAMRYIVLAYLASIVLFVVLFVAAVVGLFAFFVLTAPQAAPRLPRELYPPHATKLADEDILGPGKLVENRYRLLLFGSDRPLCEARADIVTNLRTYGWKVTPDASDNCWVFGESPDGSQLVHYNDIRAYHAQVSDVVMPEHPVFVTLGHNID